MDPKIVVDVLNRKSKCLWKIPCLVHQIWIIQSKFEVFVIKHVWREVNQPTDFLVSWATSDAPQYTYTRM